MSKSEKQFCTFYVGNYLMGINSNKVQEILRRQMITPVPLSHSCIQGLINLRGQIIPALNGT